jgi:Concanavalin A-like lectin/glucanases superfamily
MFLASQRLNFFEIQPSGPTPGNTTTLLHFDNNISDSSGYAVIWALNGSTTYTTTNKFGGYSLNANGTSKFAYTTSQTAYNWGTGDFTVECWQYTAGASNQGGFLWDSRPYSGGGSSGQKVGLVIWNENGGDIQVGYQGGGTGYTVIAKSSSVSNSTWYHIAISRASGITRCFLNGTQFGTSFSDSNNYGFQLLNTAGHSVLIGCPIDNESNSDYIYIDEVRVSKIARYTSNFTSPTSAFTND